MPWDDNGRGIVGIHEWTFTDVPWGRGEDPRFVRRPSRPRKNESPTLFAACSIVVPTSRNIALACEQSRSITAGRTGDFRQRSRVLES
jgi:hypothetical protein